MVLNSLWLAASVRESAASVSRSSSCRIASGAVAAASSAGAAAVPPQDGDLFAFLPATALARATSLSPALPRAFALLTTSSPPGVCTLVTAGKGERLSSSLFPIYRQTCKTFRPYQLGAVGTVDCLSISPRLHRFNSSQPSRSAAGVAGETRSNTSRRRGTIEGLAKRNTREKEWHFSFSRHAQSKYGKGKAVRAHSPSKKGVSLLRLPSSRIPGNPSSRTTVCKYCATPARFKKKISTGSVFAPSSPCVSYLSFASHCFSPASSPPPAPSSLRPSASFSAAAVAAGPARIMSPGRFFCSLSTSSSTFPRLPFFPHPSSRLFSLSVAAFCSSPPSLPSLYPSLLGASVSLHIFSPTFPSRCPLSSSSPLSPLAAPPSFFSLARPLLYLEKQRRAFSQRILVEKANDRLPPSADILKGLPTPSTPESNGEYNYLKIDRDNPTLLLEYFAALLKKGNLEPNPSQKQLMLRLQALADQLEAREIRFPDRFDPSAVTLRDFETRNSAAVAADNFKTASFVYSPERVEETFNRLTGGAQLHVYSNNANFLSRWWCAGAWRGAALGPTSNIGQWEHGATTAAEEEWDAPRGLYIYGGVGQGKTMIMDAFFDCLRVRRKMRVHFHQFMTVHVQQRLQQLRAAKKCSDPLFEVAKEIRGVAHVLCFDEFQVVHITDSMILKGLFDSLFQLGVTMVATSNRPPQELYSGGLNRERFLPFIDLLLEKCDVFHIDTHKDYRLAKLTAGHHGLYVVPARKEEEIIKQMVLLTHGKTPHPGSIPVAMGRVLQVPLMAKGVAKFTFSDLCEASVGPADYLAIAQAFHTVFLSDIPDLHNLAEYPNEVRRFINLIDVLYEKNTRVIFDAAAPPFRLLGTTETTDEFEKLRQALQKQFATLQDFFDALDPYCIGEEGNRKIEEEKWLSAGQATTTGLSEKTLRHVFEKLDRQRTRVLPLENIRAGLLFHMQNFDEEPPTPSNHFLYGGRKSTTPLPSIGYELNNVGASDGANDNKFACVRTISRIREMISTAYVQAHQKLHGLHDLEAFGLKRA